VGVEVLWEEKLRTASFEIAALAADLSPRPWLVHLVPLLKAHWTTHNRSAR